MRLGIVAARWAAGLQCRRLTNRREPLDPDRVSGGQAGQHRRLTRQGVRSRFVAYSEPGPRALWLQSTPPAVRVAELGSLGFTRKSMHAQRLWKP